MDVLLRLKNPMSTEDRKIRGMDYSWWRDRQVGKLLVWYQGVTPYGLVVILLTAFEVTMFVVQRRGG